MQNEDQIKPIEVEFLLLPGESRIKNWEIQDDEVIHIKDEAEALIDLIAGIIVERVLQRKSN